MLAILWIAPSWGAGYPYGQYILRAGDTVSDSPPPLAGPVQAAGDAAPVEARLLELEEGGGPYSGDLAEVLAELAAHYRGRGDSEEALRLYRRALHVVRINEGLYSERQAPLVRAELDIYRERGHFAALDERYDYYFRLFGGGRPPLTEVRLRAALGYLRWQREALRLGLPTRPERRLLDLVQLNGQMLDNATASAGLPAQARARLALSQLNNLYLVQDMVPLVERDPFQATAFAAPGSRQDPAQQDFVQRRGQNLRSVAYAQGVDLLQGLIAGWPVAEDVEQLAALHLALGDWHQWHDKWHSAAPHYQAVERLLRENGRRDTLDRWLGAPVELPASGVFNGLPEQPLDAADAAPAVTLSYDVDRRGRARNIATVALAPDQENAGMRVVRALREVRFRPRWRGGAAQDSTGLLREYRLLR